MSVLDMFASALGAFIIIVIILFPYYNDSKILEKLEKEVLTSQKLAADLTREIDNSKEELSDIIRRLKVSDQTSEHLDSCSRSEKVCKAALTKTFLVVAAEWDELCDVDLHVKDPAGREFSYSKPNFAPDSSAELSLDMRSGPGLELWQEPSASLGSYEITFEVQALKSASVKVRGWVIDRSGGRRQLPAVTLTSSKSRVQAARITIEADGSATISSPGL